MVEKIETTDEALDGAFRYVAGEILNKANVLITTGFASPVANINVTDNQ